LSFKEFTFLLMTSGSNGYIMKQYGIIIDSLSQVLGVVNVRFTRLARELGENEYRPSVCERAQEK
jgi:hypothetical protein